MTQCRLDVFEAVWECHHGEGGLDREFFSTSYRASAAAFPTARFRKRGPAASDWGQQVPRSCERCRVPPARWLGSLAWRLFRCLAHEASHGTQSLVDGTSIWKDFRNIRVEENDVSALGVSGRGRSTNRLGKIVLGPHCIVASPNRAHFTATVLHIAFFHP
jgi:hypothetical protein